MRFPSIKDVALCLRQVNAQYRAMFPREQRIGTDDDGPAGCDVRLQVMPDGSWTIWDGDSSYDTDHRGYWGCGSVDGERFNSRELARDLIEQCREQKAQGE